MIYYNGQPEIIEEVVPPYVIDLLGRAANGGPENFGFPPAGGILVSSVVLYTLVDPSADLTSVAISCAGQTILDAATASFAALEFTGDQVANETNEGMVFAGGGTAFSANFVGTGAGACDFRIIITYRPFVRGERITT